MKKITIGIDSGSTMCKAVVFDSQNVVDTHIMKTGWNPQLSAKESYGLLLKRNKLDVTDVIVSVTGYGRESIDFADKSFTEITCHAYGGLFLVPEIQGIIDIGGQDSKVIQTQNSKVINFIMNDKCAAGTGRFLSMACDTLGVSLEDIDRFVDFEDAISINSMCTVFAESEIIGLLSAQKDRSKIMAGVLKSIAQKIQQMISKFNLNDSQHFLMTGGLSKSVALTDIISQTINQKVITHPYSTFAGAIGACICISKNQ